MSRTIAGEDPLRLREAFAAFRQVDDHAGLQAFLDQHPVASTPAFAALLRQEYLGRRTGGSESDRAFQAKYADLFWFLHVGAYAEQGRRALDRPAAAVPATAPACLPRFHAAVLGLLDGRLPPLDGPPDDPSRDAERIRDRLAGLLGHAPELPVYEPTPGVLWTLLGLSCPRCGLEYPAVRAHAVDLLVDPDLGRAVLSENVNDRPCARCGEVFVRPLGVFLEDPPRAGDPLASLSCLWRLAHDFIAYQPPPGTTWQHDLERVLEVRCALRVEDLGWHGTGPPGQTAGARAQAFTVAYWAEDIARHLLTAAPDAMPRAMRVHVEEIARKVRRGELPLAQAEEQIFARVPALATLWPVLGVPPPGAEPGALVENLVFALVAEATARGKDIPHGGRALLASLTTAYFLALNENAAAERSFARAEDLLAKVGDDDPIRPVVAAALHEQRADLLQALGRPADAEAIREGDLPARGALSPLAARVVDAERRERTILLGFEQGRLAEARDAYPACVAELRALLAELEASDDRDAAVLRAALRHHLSGAIANHAAVLQEIAERDADPVPLRARAREMLMEALAMSEAQQAWDFAAVQSHRLMWLAQAEGNARGAAEYAERAIGHAEKAGDHVRAWTAQFFLADRLLERGDGVAALARLEKAAVEWMREAIGRGHHVGPDDAVVAIGDALLRSTRAGADRSAAVLALESVKAVTTASSLATGFPIRPGAADEGAFAPRIQDAHRRREALRLRHMWSPDAPGLDEQLGAHTAELAGLRQQQSLRDPRFAAWVDASDASLSGLDWIRPRLLSLGPRTRLLGTFAGPDATWTYLVGPDGTRLASRPGAGTPHGGRFDEAALAALADTLLSPFVDEIEAMQPDDRLLVSPDFGYFDVPLAALPLRGKRLCERVTLSLVQGTGVLEAVLERRREHRRVLALGGPRRPDRDDLPGALAEARHIAELFGPAGTPLLGRQATVPALVEALRESDVLHLACHAAAAGAAEPLARLLLAPDVRGNDSGVLSEDRVVAELALAEGAFVNLAGCATARQQRSSGPLMGGLVPAFLVAGAGSVLCTVHPLADGAATRFQEAFYRHLIAGRSPAQSLAGAQRDCLRGELGPGLRQVQAWAFYVIYGVG